MTCDTPPSKKLDTCIALAESAMTNKDWISAIPKWQYIIDEFENFPAGVYIRQARAFIEINDLKGAEKSIRDCLKIHHQYQGALNILDEIKSRQAKRYEISIRQRAHQNNKISHLDINHKQKIGRSQNFKNYALRGWVETYSGQETFLLIKGKQKTLALPLNESRKDVSSYFLKNLEKNTSDDCGFNYTIDVTEEIEVGFKTNEEEQWHYTISLRDVLEVVRGKDDWLFLANDTNQSIDLFTGKICLQPDQSERWHEYSRTIKKVQSKHKTIFLISNSKEKVVPQFYPYQPSTVTVTEQVENILNINEISYINPIKIMQNNLRSYYKTDTHWSDLGAFLAFKECMKTWGIDHDLEDSFEIEERHVSGDLGSKLTPPTQDTKLTYKEKSKRNIIHTFTNHLAGTGDIETYENKTPKLEKSIILFGGSSLFNGGLFKYFLAIFKRTTIVNLPGGYIEEVVTNENPDYILIQTNERYLTSPGKILKNLSELGIEQKIKEINQEKIDQLLKKKYPNGSPDHLYQKFIKSICQPKEDTP